MQQNFSIQLGLQCNKDLWMIPGKTGDFGLKLCIAQLSRVPPSPPSSVAFWSLRISLSSPTLPQFQFFPSIKPKGRPMFQFTLSLWGGQQVVWVSKHNSFPLRNGFALPRRITMEDFQASCFLDKGRRNCEYAFFCKLSGSVCARTFSFQQ